MWFKHHTEEVLVQTENFKNFGQLNPEEFSAELSGSCRNKQQDLCHM